MAGRIPLLSRQAAPAGPRAAPSDYVDPRGQFALAGSVGALAEAGARITDNYERSRAQRAAGEALGRLRDSAAEIAANPDATQHDALFSAEVKRTRDEFGEGLAPGYRDLYEGEVDEIESRLGLEVRVGAQKRLLEDSAANDDWTLGELANEAARAASDADRAVVEGKVAQVMGRAKASGQWDQADVDKRVKAYRDAVAAAALARGLADDPAATRAALEAGAGPFGAMDEKERQAGILAAEKRIAAAERSNRAEARYQQAQLERAQQQATNATGLKLENAARTGELTPDLLREAEDVLVLTPGGVSIHRHYSELLAKGGRAEPTPPEPGYFRQMIRLRAEQPGKFADLVIDPKQAGNQFEELVTSQGKILAGEPSATEPYWRKVNARWGRVADVSWGLDVPSELEDDFWVRAEVARQAFYDEPDHKRNPNGVEMEEILDQVVLDFTRDHGRGTNALSGVGLPPEDARAATGTAVTPQAQAATASTLGVTTSDLQKIDGQLRSLGRPLTFDNRQLMRDAAIREGLIVP